jgi:hypothetical protein
VKLHSFVTGAPINIVRRQLRGEPKVLALDLADVLGVTEPDDLAGSLSTEGALVGRVTDLDTTGQGADVAVITEGVADTLAAVLAFPGCAIGGANGAGRMVDVARAVVPRIVEARGWLLVVPHNDDAGINAAGDALRLAMDAGLKLRESALAVDLGAEHKDLADAWHAGWRWQWPDERGCRGPGGAV